MKKILLLLFMLTGIQQAAFAQNLFDVSEKDTDGNWQKADGSTDTGYKNNRISDINSTLHIEFIKENIALAADTTTGIHSALFDKIKALKAALLQQENILKQIDNIVRSIDYSTYRTNPDIITDKLATLQKLTTNIDNIEKIDSRIVNIANSIGTGDPDEIYSLNFKAAAILLEQLETELDDYAEKSGISVRFGGWLVTKNGQTPLHFDGFDTYDPQERYEVERWMLLPNAEQLKEIEEMQKLARENKDSNLSALKQMATAQVNAFKNVGLSEYNKYKDSIDAIIAKVQNNASVVAFYQQAKDFNTHLTQLKNELSTRSLYYNNIITVKEADLAGLLTKIKEDSEYLKNQFIALQAEIIALKGNISPTVLSVAADINGPIDNLLKKIEDDITFFKGLANENGVIDFLVYGRKFDIATLEFGDQVLQQSLNEVKQSFDFELADSGVRQEGDRIVLKMAVHKAGTEAPVKEQSREIYLFKVLTHTITTVGVVFNDPFTPTAIESNFQMAPYYHLLFKGWMDKKMRRKSVAYNQIFDWGVGLHACSPDFNKDDVPELGVGLVISGLHDYLQSGVGYNIFTGDPYWFFGIRIPTPSFGSSNR